MNALMNASRSNLPPARDITRGVNRWINELADETAHRGNLISGEHLGK